MKNFLKADESQDDNNDYDESDENPYEYDEVYEVKPIVTKSEDYPSPSKPSQNSYQSEEESEEEWETKEGIIFNIEKLVESMLRRETAKLITEHQASKSVEIKVEEQKQSSNVVLASSKVASVS